MDIYDLFANEDLSEEFDEYFFSDESSYMDFNNYQRTKSCKDSSFYEDGLDMDQQSPEYWADIESCDW